MAWSPAGQTDADAITDTLVDYGIATSGDLTARSTARTDLAALRDEAVNGWTIPAAVYTPMEAWDFPAAGRAMAETTEVIADVDAVAAALPAVKVDANPVQDRLASAATLEKLTKVGILPRRSGRPLTNWWPRLTVRTL